MTLVIWGIVLSNVAIAYLAFHCGYIWAYILLAIFPGVHADLFFTTCDTAKEDPGRY